MFQILIDILRHPLVFTDRIFAIICRQCNSEIYALVDKVYTEYPEYKKGFTNALEYLETIDVDEEEMDDMIDNYRFRLDEDFSYKLLNPQLCSHYEEDQCYNGIFLDTQKIMTKKQISTSDWLPEYDELIQLYNSEINTHICTLFDWLCTNNYLKRVC